MNSQEVWNRNALYFNIVNVLIAMQDIKNIFLKEYLIHYMLVAKDIEKSIKIYIYEE